MNSELSEKTIEDFKKLVEEATIVYTIKNHSSKSGKSHWLDFYIIQNNTPLYISKYVSALIGAKRDYRGVRINICGADPGYMAVYKLSARLFGDGYKLIQKWLW